MRRKFIFGALVLAALAVFLVAACDNGTTGSNTGADEPLVYSDVVNGKTVEITISRTDPSRAVLTPRAGDYYVIKYNGVVVSKGQVTKVESSGRATFTPASDSPGPKTEFVGTFATGSLSLPSIPTEDGDLTGVDATPDGGSATSPTVPTTPTSPTSPGGNSGGNNGGTQPTSPTSPTEPAPVPTKVGTVTLTDISAEYEGKYASFNALAGTNEIMGYESLAGSDATFPQISDGTVTISVWAVGTWFTGNETAGSAEVYLFNNATVNLESDNPSVIAAAGFQTVTFSAGSAAVSWNDRILPVQGTYTEGGVSLAYDDKAAVSGGTTHYLLTDNYDTAMGTLKAAAAYGDPDEESNSIHLRKGSFLSVSPDFVIFEVTDNTANGGGTEYRLVETVGGTVTRGAIWDAETTDPNAPAPGTYTEGGVSLAYTDTEETTNSWSGTPGYKTTHYLLSDDYTTALGKLEAAAAYGFPPYNQDGDDIYSGTSLSQAANFVILEVNYFGDWGTQYSLIEHVSGAMNHSAIWQSDELKAEFGNASSAPEPENNQLQLKPSNVLLDYVTYEKTTYPTCGMVQGNLTFADEDDFDAVKAVLESFGTADREQDYTGARTPDSTKVILRFTDYTEGDPTFPYNGGVNNYTIEEIGTDSNGDFSMRIAEWYPSLN